MTAAAPIDYTMDRAEQRRRRLLAIEREQHLEDQEALRMTEEQFSVLTGAFSSVKFEVHDLDGLRWTSSALHSRQHQPRAALRPIPKRHASPVYMLAGKRDLGGDETIRNPSRKAPPSSLQISYTDESNVETPMPSPSPLHDSTASTLNAKRDGTRQRLPVKGLFQVAMEDVIIKPQSWQPVDENRDQVLDSSVLLCPPSPVCSSVTVFEDSPILPLPQYRGRVNV